MSITKRQALRKAAKIWKWLSENPGKSKEEAYCTLGLEADLLSCPLCRWSRRQAKYSPDRCKHCPTWPGNPEGNCYYNGTYGDWSRAFRGKASKMAISKAASAVLRDIRSTKGY